MHNPPKLLVSTLYCGENELDQCKEMIQRQTCRNFEHKVYSFLPNKEAHDRLFRDFVSNPEYDFLIKIDADLVLKDTDFFERVIRTFEENPKIDLLEFVVYDFFERVVNLSLNCYRQGFTIFDNGDVFTDRIVNIPKERRMIVHVVSSTHCPDPGDYQSFHFGYHAQFKRKAETVRNTYRSYLCTLHRQRALAMCGAIAVMRTPLDTESNKSYDNEVLRTLAEPFYKFGTLRLFLYIVFQYNRYRIESLARRATAWLGRKFQKSRVQ